MEVSYGRHSASSHFASVPHATHFTVGRRSAVSHAVVVHGPGADLWHPYASLATESRSVVRDRGAICTHPSGESRSVLVCDLSAAHHLPVLLSRPWQRERAAATTTTLDRT